MESAEGPLFLDRAAGVSGLLCATVAQQISKTSLPQCKGAWQTQPSMCSIQHNVTCVNG